MDFSENKCLNTLNIISFLYVLFQIFSFYFPTKLVNFDQTSESGVQCKDIDTYCHIYLICQNDFLFFVVPCWVFEEYSVFL